LSKLKAYSIKQLFLLLAQNNPNNVLLCHPSTIHIMTLFEVSFKFLIFRLNLLFGVKGSYGSSEKDYPWEIFSARLP
jgi:hypothetical protein